MSRFALWGAAAGALWSLAAPAVEPPCTSATPACSEMLAVPGSQKKIAVYRTHALDARHPEITRALVVIHGLGRNAKSYYRSALAGAALADALSDTIVITPHFASNEGRDCHDTVAADELSWHCEPRFDTWRHGGLAVDGSATSFDVADELLRKLDSKESFPSLRSIVIAGHSAGGQFVNRYEMANTLHDKLRVKPAYVVANPSSYAYFDELRPAANGDFAPYGGRSTCAEYNTWPYGMQDRNGYAASVAEERLKTQLAARKTTYLLGELDVLPVGGFDASCRAMAQGPTRLARGLNYAKYVNERYGAKHAVMVVPSCGHNGRCMLTAEKSLPLLFPK
jgi:pimeloyl-ACP methyl ester carboxylesterase